MLIIPMAIGRRCLTLRVARVGALVMRLALLRWDDRTTNAKRKKLRVWGDWMWRLPIAVQHFEFAVGAHRLAVDEANSISNSYI